MLILATFWWFCLVPVVVAPYYCIFKINLSFIFIVSSVLAGELSRNSASKESFPPLLVRMIGIVLTRTERDVQEY